MNSTPPHFTWRPRLSNATCQMLRNLYAQALFNGHDGFDASSDDREQAVAILIDVVQILRRVMGPSHPQTKNVELCLRNIRGRLALGVYDSLVTNRNSV